MATLLLLGAGGHARVVAETALATGHYSRLAFLDDRCFAPDEMPDVLGWPVLGPLAMSLQPEIRQHIPDAAVAIGNPRSRLNWSHQLAAVGYRLPVLIHPTAWVSPSAQIGDGTVVLAQVAIQAQVVIGNSAILNTGCSVDHDAHLGDGVHICPGARVAGEVAIGSRSWIGIGSSVIQQIRIGADVTVGAGGAVVRDLPDGVTAVGVPARVLTIS